MPLEPVYKSVPFVIGAGHGVIARPIIDRAPLETWLSLFNCEGREESALSSRYGSLIQNRDPNGTPGGTNYFLPSQVSTISRLKGLGGLVWRYAQSGSTLYRKAGDGQGQYAPIANGLSGKAFSTIVGTTFASGLPYLFIADAAVMLKDSGTGFPTRWGILPPTQVAYAIPYASTVTLIDGFTSAAGYTTSGFSGISFASFATVNGTGGVSQLGGNYLQYACGDGSLKNALLGMLGTDAANNALRQFFNLNQAATSFAVNPMGGGALATPIALNLGAVSGTVAANSTGSIGKTANFNFGANLTDDLFILAIKVSNPAAVQEIRVQFDINGSHYTSSYYYKSVTPPSFQSAVSLPQTTPPSQAVNSEVFSRAGGGTNLKLVNAPWTQIIPIDDPSIGQLQPSALTTGAGSWSVMFLRLGDFLAVGNAGQPGLDWSNVTGWQIQIITSSQGSTTVSLNGLYLQSGGGASSYGGLGYDYRYTYYNVATGTESNPSGQQYFAVTQSNPAGTPTLILLRQPSSVTGQYSNDPQVSHVRIYRRGGSLNQNWQLLDQIPNVTGTGAWSYQDLISDAFITQSNLLNLANDAPVTSSLQVPFNTTLAAPLAPVAPFAPITVNVLAGTFVPGQKVVVGTPENLELVYVVTGGTGTFTACMQLNHATGEQVQVSSLPAVPCNLAAFAYNQMWLAGDPNNPHLLYYSNPGYPENFSPAQYIKVSSPKDPITAVINFRGALYVSTLTTWYLINPGAGSPQPTGSKHGCVAPFGWCQTENAIWYRAIDGIREFTGADGPYRTLMQEWIFQQGGNAQIQALSPIPFASSSNPSLDQMAFFNNKVYLNYLGQDGLFHQLRYHTIYKRWEDRGLGSSLIIAPALFLEEDTNVLLGADQVNTLGSAGAGGWAIRKLAANTVDYDDGGWASGGGGVIQVPVNIAPQTPYFDHDAPNQQKQFNVLTIDANTNGQLLTVFLLFDDGVTQLNVGTIQSNVRQKFQLQVNAGKGQQAYRVALKLTGAIVAAPIIYQADLHYALLAEQRSSYDSYWVKFGGDETKLVKQVYIDYTSSAAVTVSVYADGAASPYYTFTLPANPSRLESVVRTRLKARKMRLFRIVVTVPSGQTLQMWSAPQVDEKPIMESGSKGYKRSEMATT